MVREQTSSQLDAPRNHETTSPVATASAWDRHYCRLARSIVIFCALYRNIAPFHRELYRNSPHKCLPVTSFDAERLGVCAPQGAVSQGFLTARRVAPLL
jgi:hypothetical protein